MAKEGRAWALETRQRRRECETCLWAKRQGARGKKALEFIADVVQARRDGETDVAKGVLVEEIHRRFKYPFTESGLHRHVQHAHGYDWPRIYVAAR